MASNNTNMNRFKPGQNLVAKDVATSSTVPTRFPKFLSLPLEIRREIYAYAMEDEFNTYMVCVNGSKKFRNGGRPPLWKRYPVFNYCVGDIPNLMQVSEHLYIEAGLVFLSNSVVEINIKERLPRFKKQFLAFMNLFPDDSAYKAIRHILFWDENYSLGLLPFKEKNWLHRFPGLTKLEIQLEYEDLYVCDHDDIWEVPVLDLIESDGGSLETILGCRSLKKFIITEEDDEWQVETSNPMKRLVVRNNVNAFAGMLRAKFQAQGQIVEVFILFLEECTRTWPDSIHWLSTSG